MYFAFTIFDHDRYQIYTAFHFSSNNNDHMKSEN